MIGLCAFVHAQSAVFVTSYVRNGVWTVNYVANSYDLYPSNVVRPLTGYFPS